MAHTEVKDVVIWTKHIHGGDVGRRLASLKGGETIELKVDGIRGLWRKMSDGRDGRPTSGIRPVGRTQAFWAELYASRRGDLVEVDLMDPPPSSISPPPPQPSDGSRPSSRNAERASALQALLNLVGQGWRSEGRTVTRDEMHER